MSDDSDIYDQAHNGAGAGYARAKTSNGVKDEDMDILGNNNLWGKLFRDIDRLLSLRVPGKPKSKFTLDESIAAAKEQGETFKWWLGSGLPLGKIRAWVDGRRVACADGNAPAKLKMFTFTVPYKQEEVLQLTTSAKGKLVVIYTLPLKDVPESGLRLSKAWDNGERILLNIAHDVNGELSIEVVVNPVRVSEPLTYIEPPLRVAAAAAGGGIADAETKTEEETAPKTNESPKMQTSILRRMKEMLRPPVIGWRYAATPLFVLLLVPLGSLVYGRFRDTSRDEHRPSCVLHSKTSGTENGRLSNEVVSQTAGENVDINGEGGESTDAAQLNQALEKKEAVKAGTQTGSRQAALNGLSANSTKESARNVMARYKETGQTSSTDNGTADSQQVELSSLAREQYVKLAASRSVYVKVNSNKPNLSSEQAESYAAFIHALRASKDFIVMSDADRLQADVVISLRFWEPNENRESVIYAAVRDLSGKLLWDDLVVCGDSASGGHSAALSDASTRLVVNFKGAVNLAQQTVENTQQSAGGE